MNYYSQNNPLWKNDKLGSSNLICGSYGCTTSCICTLASWFGEKITPKVLSGTTYCYTKGGLILWQQLENLFTKIKFHYRYYSFNEKIVDDALINPDTVILFNINNGKHWVSGLAKSKTGYKVSDPYPYPSKTRIIKSSEIVGSTILIKK